MIYMTQSKNCVHLSIYRRRFSFIQIYDTKSNKTSQITTPVHNFTAFKNKTSFTVQAVSSGFLYVYAPGIISLQYLHLFFPDITHNPDKVVFRYAGGQFKLSISNAHT